MKVSARLSGITRGKDRCGDYIELYIIIKILQSFVSLYEALARHKAKHKIYIRPKVPKSCETKESREVALKGTQQLYRRRILKGNLCFFFSSHNNKHYCTAKLNHMRGATNVGKLITKFLMKWQIMDSDRHSGERENNKQIY